MAETDGKSKMNMEIEYTKEQIEDKLVRFQNSVARVKLDSYFNRRSIFDILGLERKEVHHSSFIAWLFEDKDISRMACKQLLFLLMKRARQFNDAYFPPKIKYALLAGRLNVIDVCSETEVPVDEGKGRVDIVIEVTYSVEDDDLSKDTLTIIVENKVFSDEFSNQTDRYYKYYIKKYPEELMLFVFLNLRDNDYLDDLTEVECSCKKYIQISYEDLYASILLPLKNSEGIPSDKRFLINEYILALTTNYKSKSSDIMVLTDEIKNLLDDFLSENNDIINLAQSISNNTLSSESKAKGRKGGKTVAWNYYTIPRGLSYDGYSNKHEYRIMDYNNGIYSLDHREIKYGHNDLIRGDWEQVNEWNKDENYPLGLEVDILATGNNRRKDYVIVKYKDGTQTKVRYNDNSQNKIEETEYIEERQ